MSPTQAESPTALPSDGVVPLESVLCTEELDRRQSRLPDYEKENRVLVALAQALADSPGTILQTMAEIMLEAFGAGSAGFSVLTTDDGGKKFYWAAISGVWKPHIGGGTPRDFGPCGDVLDRNAPLLFRHFERRYTYFQPVTPPVEECLLVPFYVEGKAVGTIWVIAHDDRREFDAEDLRQLVSLASFASSAYQTVSFNQKTVAMNEALMLGSLRQHELTEAADLLNAKLQTEMAARKEGEEQRVLLMAELDHRLKNTFVAVQSIARLTSQNAASLDQFHEAFDDRLMALSQTHDLLTLGEWRSAPLREVIMMELSPYHGTQGGPRVTVTGEDVQLDARQALALGLSVHELANNAAKYGALSVPNGRIDVAWDVIASNDAMVLKLRWVESGGPVVEPPLRRGFGSRLIESGIPSELGADVQLEFHREGVRFTLTLPLDPARA